MDEILATMEKEKRARIINSAIDEFAKYPYEKASTNNIVKNAGISKGLLFHYFGSKKELYEKLSDFVFCTLSDKITSQINWEEADILERIKQLVIFKIKLGKKYPTMFDFIVKIIAERNAKNIEDTIELYEDFGIDVQSLLSDLYTRNIDYSKFRDQSSIDKSLNIIRWTLEKYAEEGITNLESMDVLKKAFY